VLCAIFSCITILTQAQEKPIPVNEPNYNKPKLFQNLPERIPVDASTLESFFNSDLNRPANINIAGIQFEGNIASKTAPSVNDVNPTNAAVVIKLTNYPGANFTVNKIINADGSTSYTGRIISFQHGDLFELQNQKGNWILVKKNYYDLINE
jgi:hypothetical protein